MGLLSTNKRAVAIGFWSAVLAAVFAASFAVLSVAFSPEEWNGIDAYADSFRSVEMVSVIPVSLLAPTMIVFMACVHYCAPEGKRVFSLVGVAFSAVYAAIICTNYYIQLFVVRLNILGGRLDGLSLLAWPNLHSIFFALEAIGYFFFSLSILAISPIFDGERLSGWVRWLLVVNAVLGIWGVIIAPFDQPLIIFASLGIWNLLFPISMVLACLVFRRLRDARDGDR